jgi:hypothetical protein
MLAVADFDLVNAIEDYSGSTWLPTNAVYGKAFRHTRRPLSSRHSRAPDPLRPPSGYIAHSALMVRANQDPRPEYTCAHRCDSLADRPVGVPRTCRRDGSSVLGLPSPTTAPRWRAIITRRAHAHSPLDRCASCLRSSALINRRLLGT